MKKITLLLLLQIGLRSLALAKNHLLRSQEETCTPYNQSSGFFLEIDTINVSPLQGDILLEFPLEYFQSLVTQLDGVTRKLLTEAESVKEVPKFTEEIRLENEYLMTRVNNFARFIKEEIMFEVRHPFNEDKYKQQNVLTGQYRKKRYYNVMTNEAARNAELNDYVEQKNEEKKILMRYKYLLRPHVIQSQYEHSSPPPKSEKTVKKNIVPTHEFEYSRTTTQPIPLQPQIEIEKTRKIIDLPAGNDGPTAQPSTSHNRLNNETIQPVSITLVTPTTATKFKHVRTNDTTYQNTPRLEYLRNVLDVSYIESKYDKLLHPADFEYIMLKKALYSKKYYICDRPIFVISCIRQEKDTYKHRTVKIPACENNIDVLEVCPSTNSLKTCIDKQIPKTKWRAECLTEEVPFRADFSNDCGVIFWINTCQLQEFRPAPTSTILKGKPYIEIAKNKFNSLFKKEDTLFKTLTSAIATNDVCKIPIFTVNCNDLKDNEFKFGSTQKEDCLMHTTTIEACPTKRKLSKAECYDENVYFKITCNQDNQTTFKIDTDYACSITIFIHSPTDCIKVRTKRGLLNFVGEVSRKLFGTARDSDVSNLEERYENLEKSTKELILSQKDMLIYINRTKTLESSLGEGLKKFTSDVDTLISKAQKEIQTVNEGLQILTMQNRLDEMLTLTYFNMQKCRRMLDLWESALLSAQNGILDPQIIPPRSLLRYLHMLESKLPKFVELLMPKTYLHGYYQKKLTSVLLIKGKKLVYHVNIPLKKPSSEFKVLMFKPTPAFIHSNSLTVNVKPQEDESILLRNKEGYYMELTELDLQSCSKNPFRHCSFNRLLKSPQQPSCLNALYQKNSKWAQTLCSRRISKMKQNNGFPLSMNTWFLSIQKKTQVHFYCNEGNNNQDLQLGNYICQFPPRCEIRGEDFMINQRLIDTEAIIVPANVQSSTYDIELFNEEELKQLDLTPKKIDRAPEIKLNSSQNILNILNKVGKEDIDIKEISSHIERAKLDLKPKNIKNILSTKKTWILIGLGTIFWIILKMIIQSYSYFWKLFCKKSGTTKRRRPKEEAGLPLV